MSGNYIETMKTKRMRLHFFFVRWQNECNLDCIMLHLTKLIFLKLTK